MSLEQIDYIVIPDTHGQYDKVAPVVEIFEPTTDMFVFLGDVVDGPNSARLIGLIRQLGDKALTVVGNHEWALRNALTDIEDKSVLEMWRKQVWPGYEDRLLDSYGITRGLDWDINANRLREVMEENGDLQWLDSLPPYFETPSFIAVHAGPRLDTSWSRQANNLQRAALIYRRLGEEPEQIFSGELGTVQAVSTSIDERTFITGHTHLSLPAESRRARGRICLASSLEEAEPLFIWSSQLGIVTINK